MAGSSIATRADAYDIVADEYYDAVSHPTCHALSEASRLLLTADLLELGACRNRVVEVGAGQSRLLAWDLIPSGVLHVVTDASRAMLDGVTPAGRALVCDSRRLPLRDRSVDDVVAVLGDPYNDPGFWSEVRRVLRPGGLVLFTTPSHEWAHRYRRAVHDPEVGATFGLRDGRTVLLPSFVHPVDDQLQLLARHGLVVDHVGAATLDEVPSARDAPKIANTMTAGDVIVRCYRARVP